MSEQRRRERELPAPGSSIASNGRNVCWFCHLTLFAVCHFVTDFDLAMIAEWNCSALFPFARLTLPVEQLGGNWQADCTGRRCNKPCPHFVRLALPSQPARFLAPIRPISALRSRVSRSVMHRSRIEPLLGRMGGGESDDEEESDEEGRGVAAAGSQHSPAALTCNVRQQHTHHLCS